MDMQNYFYPFFWQHGEASETLIHYIEKIEEAGMKAVCIESRPHPDFVGEQWWADLSVIIEECRKRQMKVWLLDDAHFPTGYANGKIKQDFPDHQKLYLDCRRFDVVGPLKGARLDTTFLKGRPIGSSQVKVDAILGIYLVERTRDKDDSLKWETVVDVTNDYHDNTIHVDVPKGDWSVLVVFTTSTGKEETTKDYLNPLDKAATKVLIDEVYAPHYQHFGAEFGKTITAFFSDEPRFGNIKGTEAKIGTDMPLPWRKGLENELPFALQNLPLLWHATISHDEREIRYTYMDVITRLYNDNFVKPLADWCQAHGVSYVGHNIEDNGAHARLGYGAGHFFRGQFAQHFSGIDVIGGQVVPGMSYHHDAYQTGGSNGKFYHYALAKLGASAAHLTPHKAGRAMCEAYGAYGWNEGVKTMKWITDHLLVRGINHIVPHAFNPKEFPDADCPPHFYAHGYNPQYRYLPQLTDYANRIMTRFNDGQHRAPVAVFYPAELEWAGHAMPVEEVGQVLTQNQIDFDIVSHDMLMTAKVTDHRLKIADEDFEVLLVPEAQYLPQTILTSFEKLAQAGLPIIFVNQLPENAQSLSEKARVQILDNLVESLETYRHLYLEDVFKELVYYWYQKDGRDFILFFNESLTETVDTRINLKAFQGSICAYDAYQDCYLPVKENQLYLSPYQTIIWELGQELEKQTLTYQTVKTSHQAPLNATWEVSYATSKNYPQFEPLATLDRLVPINQLPEKERLVGTVAYETRLYLTKAQLETIQGLNLGRAYEVTQVFVNGCDIGVRIAPPYIYSIVDMLQEGENHLRIEVTNTLGTEQREYFSQFLMIEPFGLTEEVQWLLKEKQHV